MIGRPGSRWERILLDATFILPFQHCDGFVAFKIQLQFVSPLPTSFIQPLQLNQSRQSLAHRTFSLRILQTHFGDVHSMGEPQDKIAIRAFIPSKGAKGSLLKGWKWQHGASEWCKQLKHIQTVCITILVDTIRNLQQTACWNIYSTTATISIYIYSIVSTVIVVHRHSIDQVSLYMYLTVCVSLSLSPHIYIP